MIRLKTFGMVLICLATMNTAVLLSQSSPPISGNTSVQGKGWPFGDSTDPQFATISKMATSKGYGYTKKDPIKVGNKDGSGSKNSRLYLNALLGPNGEIIQYERKGSCCPFKTPNGIMGGGLLDIYEVTYKGLGKPVTLYVNMYDSSELLIPVGLTARKH
ncbi:MAG: 2-dehydro-3-deoxyphosphooctonate aldolase [Terriglobia bacterium]